MHLAPLIRDLAVILGVAGIVTLIFRRIRQPVVLGYILSGLIIGPNALPFSLVSDIPNIRILAELGVIFLMFTLGLEFSFHKLARVGVTAALTATFEVSAMLVLGFLLGKSFGWRLTNCLFLGAMMSISSTTIIIRTIDELGLKTRKFADLVFGILIVEDLAAILILVALTTFISAGVFSPVALASSAGKLALVVGSWFIAGYLIVPRFLSYAARWSGQGPAEALTVASVGLCLLLVVFATQLGYSSALGAFIMGSIIGESAQSEHIEELMRPLRDLFAAIFFVSVGILIDPQAIWANIGPVAAISVALVTGKILFVSIGAVIAGQSIRNALQVGFALGQIGEFSFIIAGLGLSLRKISPKLYPIAVAVSIITTFLTPYLMRLSLRAADVVEARLPQGARDALRRYELLWETRGVRTHRDPEFGGLALRWFVNAFIVTAIWFFVDEALNPFLRSRIPNSDTTRIVIASVALGASAPFLWATLTVFRERLRMRRYPARLLLLQLGTLGWLAMLSLHYLPPKVVAISSAFFGLLLIPRLYRNLGSVYHSIEAGFTTAFRSGRAARAGDRTAQAIETYRKFAPWDAHLVRLQVSPNSRVSGKRLDELGLRNRFGISIVAIRRGTRAIVAPQSTQQIFPSDELLVLGTDEQIEKAKPVIEAPGKAEEPSETLATYEMRSLLLQPASDLAGRTIRKSGIRERWGGMVVGIERDRERMVSPRPDFVLRENDLLWVVGSSEQLNRMFMDLR